MCKCKYNYFSIIFAAIWSIALGMLEYFGYIPLTSILYLDFQIGLLGVFLSPLIALFPTDTEESHCTRYLKRQFVIFSALSTFISVLCYVLTKLVTNAFATSIFYGISQFFPIFLLATSLILAYRIIREN